MSAQHGALMSAQHDPLGATLVRAIDAGVLPAEATRPDADTRPWPVLLLTALGAWLAAIPLLIVVGLLVGDLLTGDIGPYVVGALVLAGAAVVLRSRAVPLFVEQLAVPALLVGGGSLGFGVFRDLPDPLAAALLALVALGLAWALPQAWLRVLLGAAAASLLGVTLLTVKDGGQGPGVAWLACHALLAVACLMAAAQHRLRGGGAWLESVGTGWWLATLAGLALWAGVTFLLSGVLGGGPVGEMGRWAAHKLGQDHAVVRLRQALSAGLALAAAARIARAWPALRGPVQAAVALVLAALSALMPTLGGVLLALALTLTRGQAGLAGAAALAAAWIVGAFYYALSWPLADKALALVAAGAVLGALAWWAMRAHRQLPVEATVAPATRRAPLWIAGATLATLAAAGYGIWQKEDLIAHGQPVYVELAPVDPRSLMQGDYMQLAFRLPDGVDKLAPPGVLEGGRPMLVARSDGARVATLLRVHAPGQPLVDGEYLIELTPARGGWMLVTDAWFFREGEADRWAQARYGEFRVAPNGRALLVGMADAQLRSIPLDHP